MPRLSAVSPLRRGSESVRVACRPACRLPCSALRLSLPCLGDLAVRLGVPWWSALRAVLLSLRLCPAWRAVSVCRPAVRLRCCRSAPRSVSGCLPCCASCACACGGCRSVSRARAYMGCLVVSRARVRIGVFFLRLFPAWQDGCPSPRSVSLRAPSGVGRAVCRLRPACPAPGAWGRLGSAWGRALPRFASARQLSRLELIGFVLLVAFSGVPSPGRDLV